MLRAILFLLIAGTTFLAFSDDSPDPILTEKLQPILIECENVKVGTKRSELLKAFEESGGISTKKEQTFLSRRCPLIALDITFKGAKGGEPDGSGNDLVESVSPAFFRRPVQDG
jgi:hypothetical protein